MYLNSIKIKKVEFQQSGQMKIWRKKGRESESGIDSYRKWGYGDKLYWEFLLSIILLWTVLSESNGPELKTRFLLLWLKPSCRILPMSYILETHLNDNNTAVLTVFQPIFIWQWESIVCFDCNCCQTLQWFSCTCLF